MNFKERLPHNILKERSIIRWKIVKIMGLVIQNSIDFFVDGFGTKKF